MTVPPFIVSIIESSHSIVTCAITEDWELLGQLVADLSPDETAATVGALAALVSSMVATIGDMTNAPPIDVWQLFANVNAQALGEQ